MICNSNTVFYRSLVQFLMCSLFMFSSFSFCRCFMDSTPCFEFIMIIQYFGSSRATRKSKHTAQRANVCGIPRQPRAAVRHCLPRVLWRHQTETTGHPARWIEGKTKSNRLEWWWIFSRTNIYKGTKCNIINNHVQSYFFSSIIHIK